MKKFAFLLVLVMAFIANATTAFTNVVGDSCRNGYPIDLDTSILADNTAGAYDTLATLVSHTYGPYSLTAEPGQPMYKGFSYYAKPITGTTPTMDFSYQLIPFNSKSDTSGLWTSVDTLDATGMAGYVDLSSRAGRAIMFRVYNYDGTTSITQDWLIVTFKKAFSYTTNR